MTQPLKLTETYWFPIARHEAWSQKDGVEEVVKDEKRPRQVHGHVNERERLRGLGRPPLHEAKKATAAYDGNDGDGDYGTEVEQLRYSARGCSIAHL